MKKYKIIRAGEIQPGDVLKCTVNVFDDSIKARRHWNNNFIRITQFYKVVRIGNNGAVLSKTKQGNLKFLYVADVISAYRAV